MRMARKKEFDHAFQGAVCYNASDLTVLMPVDRGRVQLYPQTATHYNTVQNPATHCITPHQEITLAYICRLIVNDI